MSDLAEAMKQLAHDAETILREPTFPDFTDSDTVQAVSDLELAGPIADLLNARNWWLADEQSRDKSLIEILKHISALERGLFQRWQDL